jgi:hypothetical protein
VFGEAVGKLMQWQAGIRSCSADRLLLECLFALLGFHAVTLWQNETFHFLYHMNIIIQTHFNSRTGKMEAKTTTERV